MEASAGGGSILVEPGSLTALSGRIAGVATGTSAARGGLAKAASAAFLFWPGHPYLFDEVIE